MSKRTDRVDELLRREIAQLILRGEIRDPRIGDIANLSITAVKVSGDLSQARVFFDLLDGEKNSSRVLAGLRASAGLLQRKIGPLLQMKRTPKLLFEFDESISRGARIESLLADLRSDTPAEKSDSAGGADEKRELVDAASGETPDSDDGRD